MLVDWHLQQGIMALMNQLEEGIFFAKIIKNQLTDNRVVHIGISVVRKTGLFTNGYTKWLELPDNQKNFAKLKKGESNAVP